MLEVHVLASRGELAARVMSIGPRRARPSRPQLAITWHTARWGTSWRCFPISAGRQYRARTRHLVSMVLYFVGLGLADEKDITVK